MFQVEPAPSSHEDLATERPVERPSQMYGKALLEEEGRKGSRVSISNAVNTPAQASSSSRKPPVEHNWVEASLITCR